MVYEHADIVIGSSLDAVIFSFNNRYPIFFSDVERPFRFDFLEHDLDLSFLKLCLEPKTLTTFDGDKKIGITKELLWERLLFLLSLDGHVPTSDLCTNIRHDQDAIVCFNEYSKIAEVRYERMHDFTKKTENDKIVCYDWVAFNSGGKHDIDFIQTDDDFVKEIWFYSSDRICGKTKVKDACAVSRIDKNLIDDFDLSETMARFKVVKEMENRGMKGLLSSYGPSGKPKHYNFKTSTISRQKSASESSLNHKELSRLKSSSLYYSKYLRYL
tara:strand:- start:4036 stop:4848 length:813 start_codon:yes stop_codon:yes gene_type:complete